jgi:hypothetical protein
MEQGSSDWGFSPRCWFAVRKVGWPQICKTAKRIIPIALKRNGEYAHVIQLLRVGIGFLEILELKAVTCCHEIVQVTFA